MNRNDEIEHVLEHWLAEGPMHMSDRLFNGTFERIDALPKQRLATLGLRLPAMTLNLRLAGAAAVLVAVAGAGLLVLNRVPAVGTRPSPSPTDSAVVSLTPAAFAAALEWKWTALGVRSFPTGIGPKAATITFGKNLGLVIADFKSDVFSSSSLSADGALTVRLDDPQPLLDGNHWQCRTGDVGTYKVDLASAETLMNLQPIGDACSTRANILTGHWARWGCPNPASLCGSELTPGRHVSAYFWPITSASTIGGRFAYVVPAGWSVVLDSDVSFFLGRPNDSGDTGIFVALDVAAQSQAADCPDGREPGVATTATAITDWLSQLPGLITTEPSPITIDGAQGRAIDVSVAEDFTQQCSFYGTGGMDRVVGTLTNWQSGSQGSFVREAMAGDGHATYVILDLPGGHNIVIIVNAPNEGTWTEFKAAAMPIIESFRFTP
jgi:hypothetical protein